MSWFARHPAWAFGLRFLVLFGILLAPLPWIADAYTTAFGTLANGPLFLADYGRAIGFRFVPPDTIRRDGSWEANLRLEDRDTGKTRTIEMNTRNFSYRSVATFLALALSARLKRRREILVVFGGGLAAMFGVSFVLTSITAFHQGFGRIYGVEAPRVIHMLHGALTTPAMLYAIPLLCFWLFLRLARNGASEASSLPQDAAPADATLSVRP